MRLICPSCSAQYEVDESVIPDEGRDVQCSNCGNTWFQRSAAQLGAEEDAKAHAAEMAEAESARMAGEKVAEEAARAESEPDESGRAAEGAAEDADDAPDHAADAPDHAADAPDDAPEDEDGHGSDRPDDDAAAPEDAAEVDDDDAGAPDVTGETAEGFRRRTLDDAVTNVLREEAEREEAARRKEGSFPETQPDLGIAAAVAATVAAAAPGHETPQDRVARIRGDEDDLDDDALHQRAARRELLPDIEEINSTLTATSERGAEPAAYDAPETMERRRSGLKLGFTTILLLAVVMLFFYVLAKPIANAVPALEPALQSYVAMVDKGRVWLDDKVNALISSMRDEQG
ncbi:MAG: zinc-ribbon domain-containing protein [Paracoccaceae bacterium]